jgi:Na+/proline symporter
MSVYDPNQQQPAWTPPPVAPGTTTVPADAQPATGADRWALIALAVSVTVLLSCIPGFSCLAPLVAGVIALTQARQAANPDRARTYGWIATAIGILILLFAIAAVILYGALLARFANEFNPDRLR